MKPRSCVSSPAPLTPHRDLPPQRLPMREHYIRRFKRLEHLKVLLVTGALLIKKADFDQHPQTISIIGDYISDRIRAQGIYEIDVLEILRARILYQPECKQKVAIDVGANIGNHSLVFSGLFARVIAFEPNPLARSLLSLNLEVNEVRNVEVQQLALSDKAGRQKLKLDKSNLGAACIADDPAPPDGAVDVEAARGDDVIDRSLPIGLIKIDVEGAEASVLRGLEKTIRKHHPVLMIEQLVDSVDPITGLSPAFAFLRELGYTALEFRPSPLFRGRWGNLMSLLVGHTTYHRKVVVRLEQRTYRALFFVTSDKC